MEKIDKRFIFDNLEEIALKKEYGESYDFIPFINHLEECSSADTFVTIVNEVWESCSLDERLMISETYLGFKEIFESYFKIVKRNELEDFLNLLDRDEIDRLVMALGYNLGEKDLAIESMYSEDPYETFEMLVEQYGFVEYTEEEQRQIKIIDSVIQKREEEFAKKTGYNSYDEYKYDFIKKEFLKLVELTKIDPNFTILIADDLNENYNYMKNAYPDFFNNDVQFQELRKK